jgi:hypothetical protein
MLGEVRGAVPLKKESAQLRLELRGKDGRFEVEILRRRGPEDREGTIFHCGRGGPWSESLRSCA